MAVTLCIYYVWASLVYSMIRTIAADLTRKAVMSATRDKDFHVFIPMPPSVSYSWIYVHLLVQVSSSQELHGIIYVWSLLFLPAILYSAPAAAIVWEFDMVLIGIDGMLLNAPLTAIVLLFHRYQLSSCLWDLVSAALS